MFFSQFSLPSIQKKIVLQKRERERKKEISRQLRGTLIRNRERRRLIFPFLSPVGFVFLASENENTYKKKLLREREFETFFDFSNTCSKGFEFQLSEDKQIVVCARISRNKRALNAPLFIHRLQSRKESKKFQRARETSKELNFGGSELWAARIRTSGFARQRKER